MKFMCINFGLVTVKDEGEVRPSTPNTQNLKKLWQINAHILKSFMFKKKSKKAPNVYLLKDIVCKNSGKYLKNKTLFFS